MKRTDKESVDPRVQHAGKAGKHTARTLNVSKGRTRKVKRRPSKVNRWRTEV